jgi:hypothetical protein
VIQQTIFHPTDTTTNDGWTETGAPLVGAAQPPNRSLPAAIFDDGSTYSPHNGNTGNWVIRKTVLSDVAGPGFFTIPTGAFPGSGGIYADDIVAAIRLNGVAVPFVGIGTGVVPAQSVPVTWLAGANTVDIEVANTVAGGTSITGRLLVEGVGMPCDCCSPVPPACANVAVLFSGVSETVAQAGWVPVNLPGTIDGITATATLSGYNSPSGTTASTTLRVTYTISPPQQRVRGLRLWNQGGGDLNDSDGLGTFTAEFYSGVTLLASLITSGANGGSSQDLLLPPGTQLSNVDSVVLRNLGKLSGSTVSPLWRELQLLEFQTVFPCRRPNGTLQWYDENGNLVPTSNVVDCATGASAFVSVPDFRMDGQAFGDGPDPAGENLCSVIPTPVSTVNLTPTGVCYDPTVAGSIQMTWTSTTSVEMEYGNPPHTSGGVNMQFSSPTLGSVTWPTNVNSMAVGEQRTSNVFGGSRRAVLTYLSGPASTAPSLTIRMTGGANLNLHQGTTDNTTPAMRWRIDFVSA